jgi:hypothetical protein
VAQMKSALNKGVTIQTYPDVADGAAIATGQAKVGGQEINVIGFYALKGTVFVSFASVALGKPAPTSEQMLAEAQTVLDRIP